ncbi:hypothetical protein SASC598O02_005000 [Snodgrassella alvi SCGC AB-598-O02]|nr:hypothetical protein SASC598O02_005000 [Snodgrassella alvi SCGC AB-598-O02]
MKIELLLAEIIKKKSSKEKYENTDIKKISILIN